MSLSGNLRTMDLPEILQWITGGRKTGTLHVERRSIQKRIVFEAGVIHTSWSNDPRESLGQFLVRERLVTEEQLFKALLRQEAEGRLLGAILVSDGAVSEEDLRRTLQMKVEEAIYDLFLWPEGEFQFKDGELPPGQVLRADMAVTGVIFEGVRRVDEWARIKEVFPSSATTLSTPHGVPAGESDLDRQFLQLATAGKSLAAIAMEMRWSEFETAAKALEMHNRGLVGAARVEAELGDAAGLIQDLLTVAATRLEQKRYDTALDAYEKVLAVDRLNQNAKKGLIAVIEARNRERALRAVPLDRIPVLAVSLADLTRLDLDAQEGFVVSRVNGEWDVQSILKLCPIKEDDTLMIFSRLLERKVIKMR